MTKTLNSQKSKTLLAKWKKDIKQCVDFVGWIQKPTTIRRFVPANVRDLLSGFISNA